MRYDEVTFSLSRAGIECDECKPILIEALATR